MSAWRLRATDDEGAMAIIALLIITTIALVIGALVGYADASVRTTVALRTQAGTAYNADGAAQYAINTLRKSTFNDTDNGLGCFGGAAALGAPDTLNLPGFYPAPAGTTPSTASSASVVCTAEPGTGAQGSPVPITSQNKPGNAILTLGQNPNETGLFAKPLNNGALRVHGGIVSDSNIQVTNGSIVTNTSVLAHTGCSGTISSVPAPNCSSGTVADPNYSFEPAFGSPANAVPTYQPVPTACPGGIVTFNPGYYDDAAALNALTNGNGSCGGSVWWFIPGTYYFDFHNNTNDSSYNPALPGSNSTKADQWTVSRGWLLAGTPVDANGNVLAKPPAAPTMPGSCQNPIDTVNAQGVQFIFGGDSQLVISGSGTNAADAEICGTYHSNRPPLAVYGAKSGTDPATVLSGANTLKLTGVTPGNFANATVTNLANADQSGNNATTFATWNNPSGNNKTGTVTVSGYAPATAIPAGSVLKSATLRVIHREPTTSNGAPTIKFTPTGGTATAPLTLTQSKSVWKTDTVDVTSALTTLVHNGTFTGGNALFSAGISGTGNEDLDTIQLDLTYIPPAFRGETTTDIAGNCMSITYSTSTSGCATLSTDTNYAGAFFIQGTTYIPQGVVDLTLNNISAQVLRFGVICRSLWVKETGSLNYDGPVIEIPDNSPGYGTASTIVNMKVYVCPAVVTSTCSTSSGKSLALIARVQIWDPNGDPTDGKRQVAILSWSRQK